MFRTIEADLAEWSERLSKSPIFLHGASRVGKTFSALQLGKTKYNDRVFRIDCSLVKQSATIFNNNQNLGGMLAAIENIHGSKIDFEKFLIIIDNVEHFPAAINAVKSLCLERKNLHIIVIGTLNREIIKKYTWLESIFEVHRVYPFSFVEFLKFIGHRNLADAAISSPLSKSHQDILKHLRDYLIVGGMPEAVECWLKEADIKKVRETQKEIFSNIINVPIPKDFNRQVMLSILKAIALNVGGPIDYKTIYNKLPLSQVKHYLDFFEEYSIIKRVFPSTPLSLPTINFRIRKFKTLFLDVGLMHIVNELEDSDKNLANKVIRTKIPDSVLCDQFVGQELSFIQSNQVQYWESSVKESTASVNYLIKINDKGLPAIIEHDQMTEEERGLDLCIGAYPECRRAYILSIEETLQEAVGKIKRVPVYCVSALGAGLF